MSEPRTSSLRTAISLGILGGIVYLLVALVVFIVGAVSVLVGVPSALPLFGTVAGLVIVGVLAIVFSILLRRQPELALFWGILLVVLALLSLSLEFGGFVVAFLLTLVSGILAISDKLSPMVTASEKTE
ncbi:MAG: hypothetical protein M1606_00230 [Candidatus Thermoplasmatota archaeon]|jgi:hypothetical protein|nr:hypothetical protein [Candidatus Thermoplasmatota archaeon]MCL5983082.1 hypothetical protein [Candidatus Thermoplasmatota archaeon]